jgi:hypothetical protein
VCVHTFIHRWRLLLDPLAAVVAIPATDALAQPRPRDRPNGFFYYADDFSGDDDYASGGWQSASDQQLPCHYD